ncbi:hypothetical protein [Dictyobacter formicarum]|uniref:Lycopene cyclase domain-containing protein n=1 Tax=Dictyobacter formicarum TaxID=2778368 RepID=A0ABQ3VQW7_9CHLR|nr:hypothetical protein [Dictyobacter formicarum]GHO87716.1 hypothetical protein KSZ_57220 [Dictyobacter formicarum]
MNLIFADFVIFTFALSGMHFFLSAGQLLCWALALVIGILARLVFGRRVPFGIFSTFVIALMGIWFATDVVLINIPKDILIYDVPVLKASGTAILFELLWYLVSYRSYRNWTRRRRLYTTSPAQEQ